MNLKIKVDTFELELMQADVIRVEKTLLGVFAYLQGESFINAYNETVVIPMTAKHTRTYVEPINGVREHANGTKEYKCSYTCECGNKGVRYVHMNADSTTCHKCKRVLKVYPSTENDAHDDDYNYFYAYNNN